MYKFDTEKQENFTYHKDEEKGVVVAVLDVPKDIVAEEMLNVLNKASGASFIVDGAMLQNSMLIAGTYRGVAYCHESDAFDFETGKYYAKRRALLQYYQDRKRVSDRVKAIFADATRRMALAADHNDYSIARIKEQLAEEV